MELVGAIIHSRIYYLLSATEIQSFLYEPVNFVGGSFFLILFIFEPEIILKYSFLGELLYKTEPLKIWNFARKYK